MILIELNELIHVSFRIFLFGLIKEKLNVMNVWNSVSLEKSIVTNIFSHSGLPLLIVTVFNPSEIRESLFVE